MREERRVPRGAGRGHLGNLQAAALVVIAVAVLLHTLQFGRAVLIPIAVAGLANIVLKPIVHSLARRGLPEPLGAALLLCALLGATVAALVTLAPPASHWLERAPRSLGQIERKLRVVKEPLERVTEASESVEKVTKVADDPTPEVRMRSPSAAEIAFERTQGFLASAAIVLVLLYFLLVSGDRLLRKVVAVLPDFGSKRAAVRIVRSTEEEVSRYLLTITAINVALGACVALAMYLLGMPNALLWGAVSALLNFVPYMGAMATAAILTVVALLTFDDVARALLVPLVFSVITALEGGFITPALAGSRLRLSPVAIFVGLTVWTWLWGIPGALLSLPILVVLRVGCDRVPALRPIAVLISRERPRPIPEDSSAASTGRPDLPSLRQS